MERKPNRRNSAGRKCPKENAQCEQKLAALSEKIDLLALAVTEKNSEFEKKLEAIVGVLAKEKAVEKAEFERKLAAMSEKINLLQEKMKTKTEFEEKLAAMSDKIDLLSEKMEEKIAAKSAEPTAIASIAPGSCARSMLANSSEQRRSQQPQLEMAPSQEEAEEQPCSLPLVDKRGSTHSCTPLSVSFDVIFEPPKTTQPPKLSRSRVKLNEEGQDITNKGLNLDQKESTAALDSSTLSQPQEEMRLPPCSLSAFVVKTEYPTLTKVVKKEAWPSETRAEKKTVYSTQTKAVKKEVCPSETRAVRKTVCPTQTKAVKKEVCPSETRAVRKTVCPTQTKAVKKEVCPTETRAVKKTVYPTQTKAVKKEVCPSETRAVKKTVYPTTTKAVKKEVCPSETRAEKKKELRRTWTKHTLKVQEKSGDPPAEPPLDAKQQHSLEDSLVCLNSHEGLMKMKGLELIAQLAHLQPGILIPKREEVCQAIIAQVKDRRWQVSQFAMWALGKLFIHLKRDMDPELVWVAELLLQKSTSANRFLHQAATFALGHMIHNCCPLRCLEALLSRLSDQSEQDLDQEEVVQGDSDDNVAVRESIVAHLLTLVETAGAQPFLGLEQEMLEHFLSTVSRQTQDASERVRSWAEKTLAILSAQEEINQLLAQLQ